MTVIVRARTVLLLFALGATLGLFLDWLHVVSGTTRYADPGFWGQPWWVPLLFGGAGAALGANRLILARWLGDVRPAPTSREVIGGLALFVLAYAASAFLPVSWATGALAFMAAVALAWLDRSRTGLIAAAGAAVAGPLTEITLIHVGAFEYVDPRPGLFVFGVAVWLPLLYVCAAASVGTIAHATNGVDPV